MGCCSPVRHTGNILNYKLCPLAFLTLWHFHPICTGVSFVPKCQSAKGYFPNLNSVKHSFFIAVPTVISTAGTPLYHPFGGAVPFRAAAARKLRLRKFLSSLGNFPSRIPSVYAENVPNEPKGSAPWRTPERLIGKPYTAIVPQLNRACP